MRLRTSFSSNGDAGRCRSSALSYSSTSDTETATSNPPAPRRAMSSKDAPRLDRTAATRTLVSSTTRGISRMVALTIPSAKPLSGQDHLVSSAQRFCRDTKPPTPPPHVSFPASQLKGGSAAGSSRRSRRGTPPLRRYSAGATLRGHSRVARDRRVSRVVRER